MCHDGRLVHPHVVDAHPAEDGEGLDKVLVVPGEGEAVELVHQLEDAEDAGAGTAGSVWGTIVDRFSDWELRGVRRWELY